uniref:Metalloendopeptidase n=1 Tax=Parastrongyloides trichosuri TaxID=131310 RepID=A0A0N4ZKX6_PARTI
MHFDSIIASQNDINIFQTDSRILIKKRMIKFMSNNWKSPIKYSIEGSLNSRVIKAAIKNIERETCLEFEKVEKLSDTEEGIKFVKQNQCSSSLGKNNGTINTINLTISCSEFLGVVQHEIGHALGLIHKHQRDDRGNYVSIQKTNIINGYSDQFDDYDGNVLFNSLNITYEYGSAMHYERIAYSTNGKPTIVVKNIDAFNRMIGQNDGFTFSDYKLINLKHCKDTCYDKLDCKNGGYLNSKSCFYCICPRGYDGNKCQYFKPFIQNCINNTLAAEKNPKLLYAEGQKKCNYHIKSSNGTKIVLILHESNTHNRTICSSNYGLEIKYFKDKGLTGLCLCGLYKNIKITSEENEAYLEYHGSKPNHYFYLSYLEIVENYTIKSQLCQNNHCYDIKHDKQPSLNDLIAKLLNQG